MKTTRRLLSFLLVLCMAAMLFPAAFADGEENEPDQDTAGGGPEILVIADGDEQSIPLDDDYVWLDITCSGSEVRIKDQSVQATESVEVTVPEDVETISLDVVSMDLAEAELSVTVEGDVACARVSVNSEVNAVLFLKDADMSMDITVRGDVISDANGYGAISRGVMARNRDMNIFSEHPQTITVEGDVRASGTASEDHLPRPDLAEYYTNEATARAIDTDGAVYVNVMGSVFAEAAGGTEGNEAIGIAVVSASRVTVEKDLETNDRGILVDAASIGDPASVTVVKGEVRTPGAAVVITVDDSFTEENLPTVILGAVMDENGDPVDDPAEKLVVTGSEDPDLVSAALERICYIVDTSGLEGLGISGTKRVDGFDGEVASAQDQLTVYTGGYGVLQSVDAGAYATVTLLDENTCLITVQPGGDLRLSVQVLWNAPGSVGAIAAQDADGAGADAVQSVYLEVFSLENNPPEAAGDGCVLVINLKTVGSADVMVSSLRGQVQNRGMKNIVVRTKAGSVVIPIDELLALAEDPVRISFAANGDVVEVYLDGALAAAYDVVKG